MNESPPQRVLLDTNIVSYLMSKATWGELYAPLLYDKELSIGFMTLAELLEAVYHKRWSENNIVQLTKRLKKEYYILPYSEAICDRFAWVRSQRRNRPISVPDAFIAATAIAYDLPLVTHNARDFEGIPRLEVITQYINTH